MVYYYLAFLSAYSSFPVCRSDRRIKYFPKPMHLSFDSNLREKRNLRSLPVEVLAGCLKVEKPDPRQWLPFHNAFRFIELPLGTSLVGSRQRGGRKMSRGGLWGLTTRCGLWGPELPASINLFPAPLPSTKQSLTCLSGPSPF